MTKNKILLVFFALGFGFCAISAGVWDGPVRVCSEYECNNLKEYLNMIYRVTNDTYNDIDRKRQDILYANSNIKRYVSNLDTDQTSLLAGLNYETGAIDTLTTQMGYSIGYWNSTSGGYGTQFRDYIDHIDCSLCSNGQCIDLTVVTNILSQVTAINTNLISLSSNVSVSFSNITNYLALLSVGVDNINTNLFDGFSSLSSSLVDISTNISVFDDYLITYLPYLETINLSLAYLATNEYFNVNVSNLSNYLVASSSAYKGSPFFLKPTSGVPSLSNPTSPYHNSPLFNRAVFADVVRGGFMNLISCLSSVNNYLYWMYQNFPTNNNDFAEISAGLASISNTLNRVDSYVLGDFSNQFYNVYSLLDSFVSNQLNSATNNFGLSSLIETNNIYTASNTFLLASIDSRLDVLDYIKILSATPLSSYSGDVDYYDYLTNLYINGSADSGGVSTNWFERMEILLASLVFGDSDGTNDIPQSVEMEGVDSSAVQSALTDFTYNQEFTGAINALDDTRQSFIGVLNGLHTSIKSVSLPASISIGLGGLDGEDTHNFEDMMHGHFQVSFNTGIADRFTIAVRAVTTVSWILLFFLALWKSGFYLIRKLVYFYRLVTRLLVSVFTR